MSKEQEALLIALAAVVEYQLRGERDKGLQALRLRLSAALHHVTVANV